jgi:hypothetical protein
MLSSHEDVILRCEIGDVPQGTILLFLLISKFENYDSFALLCSFNTYKVVPWGTSPFIKSVLILWRERRPVSGYGH